MGFRLDGSSPIVNELLRGFLSVKVGQTISIPTQTSGNSEDNSKISKGREIFERSKVSFSDEAKNMQQMRKDVGPEALKAYGKLTKEEKSRLADTLNGTSKKKIKTGEIDIDNKKSFISGHPYVTNRMSILAALK